MIRQEKNGEGLTGLLSGENGQKYPKFLKFRGESRLRLKGLDGRSWVLLTSAALLVALSSSEVFSSSFLTSGVLFSASADMVCVVLGGLAVKIEDWLGIELTVFASRDRIRLERQTNQVKLIGPQPGASRRSLAEIFEP